MRDPQITPSLSSILGAQQAPPMSSFHPPTLHREPHSGLSPAGGQGPMGSHPHPPGPGTFSGGTLPLGGNLKREVRTSGRSRGRGVAGVRRENLEHPHEPAGESYSRGGTDTSRCGRDVKLRLCPHDGRAPRGPREAEGQRGGRGRAGSGKRGAEGSPGSHPRPGGLGQGRGWGTQDAFQACSQAGIKGRRGGVGAGRGRRARGWGSSVRGPGPYPYPGLCPW